MNKFDIEKMLDITNDIHLPIPINEDETAEKRLREKPVIKSRLLHDMESLTNIEEITPYAKIALSTTHSIDGTKSLKLSAPTNLNGWGDPGNHMYSPGRIYAVPAAKINFDREDWTDYNRLSFYVYPDVPGIKSPTFRVQFFNDGKVKVPDKYLRDGAHNFSLKNGCWNHVVVEIPYLDRDAITGIAFEYDMLGHENDAVDNVIYYIDKVELQEVECDVYEGYIPAKDRISYSHSGYQTGAEKIAVISDTEPKTFKVIETKTGKVVLEKAIEDYSSMVGNLRVLDFSEVAVEGEYIIICGNITSRVFEISNDVWESSVWKVINFFLNLRCGYEVFGKHRACHSDMILEHNGMQIIANGGWHDAGDLAQGLNNTSEATQALFSLALSLKGKNDRLYKRVLEEAKWGLDYVLKTRFGDGYRAVYSSCSIWTDGIIGTHDDIKCECGKSAYANLNASYAECLAAIAYKGTDDDLSRYSLKIAIEDFELGFNILKDIQKEKLQAEFLPQFILGDSMDVQVYSIAAIVACELFKLTSEEKYKEYAENFSDIIIGCQEQEITDWDTPMVGFFYQDLERDLIWHHNHMSYAYLPDLALKTLCETFTGSEKYIGWVNALILSGEYYKALSKFTMPYDMIPSGVYHEDEAEKLGQKVLCNHPMCEDDIIPEYKNVVRKGFPLGKGYYVRVYPVWFSFRGDYNVLLSEAKSINSIMDITNDLDLYNIAQRQHEWIVGKNPMCQSTLYGEGYDYIQHYAVQPGQSVGSITVGMESHFENDEPFWPQVNNATYKEVWVCPATKWIWNMADSLSPSTVSGYLKVVKGEQIIFTNIATNISYTAIPHEITGFFEITLPCGSYKASYGGNTKNINITPNKAYKLNGELYNLDVKVKEDNDDVTITLMLNGSYKLNVELKSFNLTDVDGLYSIEPNREYVFKGKLKNAKSAFTGIIIPEDNTEDKIFIKDTRLQ